MYLIIREYVGRKHRDAHTDAKTDLIVKWTVFILGEITILT